MNVCCLIAVLSVPFAADRGTAVSRPAPTGGGTIAVAAPQNAGGSVLNAADYGFSPTNDDNGAAIAAAVRAAKRVGAAKVRLEPGVYRCFGDPIVMDGLVDFELDGCGAELVFRRAPRYPIEPSWDHDGSGANFVISNCRRVRVGNLVTDWDWRTMPLATRAKVVATHVDDKTDNASYIDYELMGFGDRHPYYGKNFPIQRTQPMTADFKRFLPGPNIWHGTYEGEMGCKCEWLSPTRVRAYPFVEFPGIVRWLGPNKRIFSPAKNRSTVREHKVGETYRIAHAYYGKGGFTLVSNQDFDLHDVEIPSCYGHAVYIGGTQRNWRLKNVTVSPRDGRHPISSTSDAIHFVRSHGNAIIDNLVVRLEQDDAINVHDRFTVAKRVGPRTLEVVLERGARYFRPDEGDVVELLDPGYNPTGWKGRCVKNEGETILVDGDLPASVPAEGYWLLFDRTASSDGIVIRNCTFEDMEMRVLVNVSNATVENCVFRRTNGDALRCIADYTLKWWAEGMGTTNIVVRNCRFEENCVREMVGNYYSLGADFVTWLGCPEEVKPGRLNRRFISDILVENCTFVDSLGYFADLRFGTGIVMRDNRIVQTGMRARCRANSGFARVERVTDVTFENNVFERPAAAPPPQLDIAEDVEGLVLRGNRVSAISASAEAWDVDPFAWSAGGGALRANGGGSFARALDAPLSDTVTFSADITPERTDGSSWCVLGLAVGEGERNFWHLACIRSPQSDGAHRLFELAEMREGGWPLQDRDTRHAPSADASGSWDYGKTYRFTLTLNPTGVSGEVRDGAGAVVFRTARLFTDHPAVRVGAPVLRTNGGFVGRFGNFAFSHGAVRPRARVTFPPYVSAGAETSVRSKATGFFRVEKTADGRWWAIDPQGRGLLIFGVDHIKYAGIGSQRTKRRRYREHNDRTYPNQTAWEDETIARLKSWGFNMLGAGSSDSLRHRGLVHTDFLSIGDRLCARECDRDWYICPNEGRPCSALPNMFHPGFPAWCDAVARRRCAPQKDDPWLFGYFFDNEFAWWGRGNRQTGLWDSVLALPAGHSARRALADFANVRGIDPEKASVADKTAFVRLAAERYFKTVSDAIRRHDPNHILLGARFAGLTGAPDVVWEVAGECCDIVTFNCYPWVDLDRNVVMAHSGARERTLAVAYGELFARVKRPMMVTEWSFPALDSGLPCTNGAGQRFRTQQERSAATELFVRSFLALPYMVGYDYFMWVDEPPEGISDAFPEDTNYGLVSEEGKPYPLTEVFARLQRDPLATRNAGVPKAKAPPPAAGWKGGVMPSWIVSGKNVGSYNVMLSFERGGVRSWHDASSVRSCVKTRSDGREHWTVVSAWEDGKRGAGYEVVHDLQFGAKGDSFVARLLAVRNTGTVPLEAPSFYFRTYAPYAGEEDGGYSDGQNTWQRRKRVPNLWKAPREDRWLARDGRYIGARTESDATECFRYYVNPSCRSQHPDACFRLGKVERLSPGETFVATGDIWVEVLGGTDGEDGWSRRNGTGAGGPAASARCGVR